MEYCDAAGLAALPDIRFDAALVDSQGRVEILERAFEEAFA